MGNYLRVWKPNLGGWLSMFNSAAWLLLYLLSQIALRNEWLPPEVISVITIGCLLPLSLPLVVIIFIAPESGVQHDLGSVGFSIFIGINSFGWGYGLAAIIRWLSLRQKPIVNPQPPA